MKKRVLKMMAAMTLSLGMSLTAMPGAAFFAPIDTCAATSSAMQGIYDALTKEGSDFYNQQHDESFAEYYTYTSSIEDNRITLSVRTTEQYKEYFGDQDADCFYDYSDDGYVTCNYAEGDYQTPAFFVNYIVGAVAEYLKMDPDVVTNYISAVEVLNDSTDGSLSSDYYKRSQADEHGIRELKLYAGAKYSDTVLNAALDRAYFDENTLQNSLIDELGTENISTYDTAGKFRAVIDGNKYSVRIFVCEYGTFDGHGYDSLKNIIAALKPAGYEDFAKEYTGTSEQTGSCWTVSIPDADTVNERLSSGDWSKYSFVMAEFTNPYISDETCEMKAGDFTFFDVRNATVKKWTSSDPKVAKATAMDDMAQIDALKKGKTTITATLEDGSTLSCVVTVTSSPRLKVSGKAYKSSATYKIKKGKTISVKITGKASQVDNAYSSTKKSVAKVTSKKDATTVKIKGLKKGKSTVTVKVNGVSFKIKVKVV